MKRILITGANSYIGESVRDYLMTLPDLYDVQIKDTIGWNPKESDFKGFDVVFNVAGIAHIKETKQNRNLYYLINRDLSVSIAKSAKEAGVKQLILLSTMSVYGLVEGYIDKHTDPHPINAYGDSKLQADVAISELCDDSFKFCCIRPPMVYGKNCKGNYQTLRKFALKSPVFPLFDNQRSMIYVGNLCEFIKCCIDDEKQGLFFPQNCDYVNTSRLVGRIAKEHSKSIHYTKVFNWILKLIRIGLVKKVFGSLRYEQCDMVDCFNFDESITLTEMD